MAVSPTPILQALRSSRLFGQCADADLARLASASAHRRLQRGEVLFRGGEQATFLGIITTGLVKIVRRNVDEADAIVALFGPRETVGNLAVAARGAYPADAMAATDEAGVLCVNADAINEMVTRSSCVACAMNRSLVEHGQALHAKIAIMSAGGVERRLGALLFHLIDRFGDEDCDGAHFIPVTLSRGELASLVGATIETTIRTMSRWQKLGVIETRKEGFRVLQPSRFRELLDARERSVCPAA